MEKVKKKYKTNKENGLPGEICGYENISIYKISPKRHKKTIEKRWTRQWKVIFWSLPNLVDDLGTLQYLVIFANEEGHKFHYTGEAASIVQPIDERVADYIRLQIREGLKQQKIFNVELGILLKNICLVDWELKRPKGIGLYHLEKRFEIWFYRLEIKQDVQR